MSTDNGQRDGVRQYMRVRELMTFEQFEQLADLLEMVAERAVSRREECSLEIVVHGKGYVQEFVEHYRTRSVMPKEYV